MATNRDLTSLEQLLDRLEEAAREHERIALGTLIEAVGRRAFGPPLLLVGLIAVSPLSGIPGVPTTVAVVVAAISGQLLFGRKQFWLPGWLLRRSLPRDRFDKALELLRSPARYVDRLLRPRLTPLTRGAGLYLIAALCVLIAVALPPLELVPFAATGAGVALATFGLSLIARDGALALIALLAVLTAAGLLLHTFL